MSLLLMVKHIMHEHICLPQHHLPISQISTIYTIHPKPPTQAIKDHPFSSNQEPANLLSPFISIDPTRFFSSTYLCLTTLYLANQ